MSINEKGQFEKGIIPWNKGKKGVYSKEALLQMSKARKGKHLSPETEFKEESHISPATEFKKGQAPWNKGRKGLHISPHTEFKKGQRVSPKTEFKNGQRVSPKTEFKKGDVPWNKGKRGIYSEETIRKIQEARRRQQIPTSKTKPEQILEDIIKKYRLPYKYTGDGSFWIGGINPDFVNCNSEKIAVEVFGNYWHDKARPNITFRETEYGRSKILAEYGWGLIIIWESELYSLPENTIVSRLTEKKGVSRSDELPTKLVKG